jgi:Peptidase family M28
MRRLTAYSTSSILLAAAWFALAAAPPKTKPQAHPFGNAGAISQSELRDYDYFLASDQLEGRNLPSRGYDVAALYVASHLNEWGLEPGGSTTGTNGPLQPYFLPIDLVTTNPNPAAMRLSIDMPPARGGRGRGFFGIGGPAPLQPGPHPLPYGRTWLVSTGGRGAPPLTGGSFADAALIFAGDGYVMSGHNPYQGLDVRGKVIVVAGLPPALARFQAAQTAYFRGGFRGTPPVNPIRPGDLTPVQYAAQNGALAVIAAPTLAQLSQMAGPRPGRLAFPANGPNYQVTKFLPPRAPSVPSLVAGLETLNALFQGERVSAAQVMAAASGGPEPPSFALNPRKTVSGDVAVTTNHNHGEDVIGILPGSDPVLKHEFVVMSAHLDHIGLTNLSPACKDYSPVLAAGDSTAFGLTAAPDQADCDDINNGADDDGSGSTGLLGIAHAYATGAAMGLRPKRTMIFLWNAGEEKGLWGSQYFNEFPPIDIHKVVVDLNMDMIGRTKNPDSVDTDPTHFLVNPGSILVVGPNISSDDLERTLESVNGRFQKLTLNHFYDVTAPDATHDNLGPGTRGQRIFYRSDHYNFAKMGIPIAFFTVGLHKDYHRVTDSPEKIDFTEIQKVSQTVAAVGWVIGNEPEGQTPKLNAALPPLLVHDMAAVKQAGWGVLTPPLPPLPGEPF